MRATKKQKIQSFFSAIWTHDFKTCENIRSFTTKNRKEKKKIVQAALLFLMFHFKHNVALKCVCVPCAIYFDRFECKKGERDFEPKIEIFHWENQFDEVSFFFSKQNFFDFQLNFFSN